MGLKYFDMAIFNPYIRSVEVNWLIAQIESLLNGFHEHKNPTLIIYGCLESRNLVERIEYELLAMAAKNINNSEFLEIVEMKNGISNANKKLNSLKFKYQSFSKIATEVLFENLKLKVFDFKQADALIYDLSQYLHIYSKTDSDMDINSDFMKNGLNSIFETLKFIKGYFFQIRPKEVVYGIFDFNTLSKEVREVFDFWLKDVTNDEANLRKILEEINLKNNGGSKTEINF